MQFFSKIRKLEKPFFRSKSDYTRIRLLGMGFGVDISAGVVICS